MPSDAATFVRLNMSTPPLGTRKAHRHGRICPKYRSDYRRFPVFRGADSHTLELPIMRASRVDRFRIFNHLRRGAVAIGTTEHNEAALGSRKTHPKIQCLRGAACRGNIAASPTQRPHMWKDLWKIMVGRVCIRGIRVSVGMIVGQKGSWTQC
jgi:hypothetical protein